MTIHEVLQKYWGYSSFRPLQEDVINSVLEGRDTLTLMPTGGGKAICFQVPTLARPGICLVISPLIALMKDQVENLKAKGIKATAIFSGMGKREIDIALDNCIYGDVKFLYISPERLQNELVQERIKHMNISLFAIDEAHCISQWGYDFRPSYLKVKVLRSLHPEVPILALTATAVARVATDIQEKLEFDLQRSQVLKKSFFRENLAYMVLFEENKMQRLLRISKRTPGSGIVYVRSRRETKEIARFLIMNNIKGDYYHAGLTSLERSQKQDAWMKNKTDVIVATNAFGMGIDKPDVRWVVHLDIPEHLEAYFQEAGRAGRDGNKAYAVLLYNEADRLKLKSSFEQSFPSVQEIAQIYFQLGNYYQLAYGAGEGVVFDFNLGDFCRRFSLNVTKTIASLKFLEKDGWITVSENVFLPSRISFEIDATELYRFQVEHVNMDALIKVILRAYGPAFDHFVDIHEGDLARKLNTHPKHIVSLLQQMHDMNVLSYLKQKDNPQLQFLRPRSDTGHLEIDRHYIRERKLVAESQLHAIFNYLDDGQCRSRKLLAYFGEDAEADCLICDVCLLKNKGKRLEEVEANIYIELTHLLATSPLTLDELVAGIESGNEKIKLDFIRKLIDSGKIKMNNGKYYQKQ